MTFVARQVLTAAQLNDLDINTLTTSGDVTVGGTLNATISAAGSDGQIQYNNGGSFGGASALYYDDVNSRVGIGTTTPTAQLTFGNTIGNKIDFYYVTTGSGDRYGIQVQSSELRIHSGAGGSGTGGITLGKSDTTTFTEHMRITNDGNVGINDSTPSYKLDVNGTGRFTGTLYFGSSAGSRIQTGTSGANDIVNLISDEVYVGGDSIVIDVNSNVDFRVGSISTMKMSNRQVRWGYTGNQGLGTADTIVGTNFGIAYEFDNSSGSASIGTGWSTILNAYATPVVTGGKRWGTSNSFTCWVLWGFSAYSDSASTKYTRVVANSSTLDYYTSEQYFFYNTTYQHQGWSFFDTINTFRQDLGTINFQLQVRSSSGSINFDVNDYKWIWVFSI